MAAKYTTAPSSTLPQVPAISEIAARMMRLDPTLSVTNAIANAGTLFDAVAAVPYTGNNLLSVCSMVINLMAGRPELSQANAINEASAIWLAVTAVQA